MKLSNYLCIVIVTFDMDTQELAINIKLPGYKKYLDEQYVRTLEPNPSDIK